MPWEVKKDVGGCAGWAVVKQGTTDVVGCHQTKTEAEAHQRALYANSPDATAAARGLSGVIRLAAEPAQPAFMTVEAVEIAHVGMDWPAASGPVTLTFQHLADAVTAANSDPHVLPPRLKIGHDDPRFNESPPAYDPFNYHGPLREDGSPVYGKATNLRLAEDGMVLLGDFVDVPAWLGASLPSAYPSRSLEGDFDVQTEGGKRYSFVITAVALLGEQLPAITCLDDLARELTGGPQAVLEQTPVLLRRDAMPIRAEASADAVRSQFFDDIAQGDRYWWWPAELRLDAGWVLADDDEGHTYRVPFTVDADGNVTFDQPVRGVLDFRAVPDTEPQEDATPVAAGRIVRFAKATDARPEGRTRPTTSARKGAAMSVLEKVREKLGLGTDEPEDAVLARLDEAKLEQPNPDGGEDGDGEEGEGAAADTKPEAVAAAKTVTVSEEVWNHTNDRLATLERTEQERNERETAARRDDLIREAVRAGRIAPAEHDHYRSMLEVDEQKTSSLLMTLTPGRIPVAERAQAGTPAESERAAHDTIMASFGVKARNGKES